ncbi:hypothetical protein [Tenacibaculum sp.]|uniref:hypothetical protein n=1 Tax=Tenacibaculum sp. TaxID=1906242 RepID=UPI003D0E9950
MKIRELILGVLILISQGLFAQYNFSDQQKYMINEWKDAYGGQIYYAYNYPKTYNIYKQLKSYSGMNYPIIFSQTFNWGQAHNGGLIILDYSTINKNKHVLAFVFAHEWGHQALGHQSNIYNPYGSTWKIRTSSTQTEDEADVYAGKFLASYGYDINTVYNYLYSLPKNNNDHTHSSGKERAKLVLRGYQLVSGSNNGGVEYTYIKIPCTHMVHPNGDITACNHRAHVNGDVYRCQHSCTNYYGQIIPCHPNGDLYPCSHRAHVNGDINRCVHRLHPNGDTKKVPKY